MLLKIFFLSASLFGYIQAADDSVVPSKIIATTNFFGLDCQLIESPVDSLDIQDTSNGYGVIVSAGFTTSAFIDRVYSQENPSTVLEIGPGDERVLVQLCKDPRNRQQSFSYHFIDLNTDINNQFQIAFSTHSKNKKNTIGCASSRHKGQALSFLTGKTSVYDAILINNVTHYLSPLEQLDLFAKIHASLKTNGTLYISQCSIVSANIWTMMPSNSTVQEGLITQFQRSIEQGDLWPGYFIQEKYTKFILDATLLCKSSSSAGGWEHPTFHSAATLSLLLETLGFTVMSCMDFAELSKSMVNQLRETQEVAISSIRVGAIVQKKEQSRLSEDGLARYRKAAQCKMDGLRVLTQSYKHDLNESVQIASNAEQMMINILREQVRSILSGYPDDAPTQVQIQSILDDLDDAEKTKDKAVLFKQITQKLENLKLIFMSNS
ncbi:MAG: class I SAM-dependent methyltransferase [Candidatus Paracaedibacteraceae bacterium]|nr:class I SAM-dependent methyltransferase [Candidatus Paracaedibacteraceae bacterium]